MIHEEQYRVEKRKVQSGTDSRPRRGRRALVEDAMAHDVVDHVDEKRQVPTFAYRVVTFGIFDSAKVAWLG